MGDFYELRCEAVLFTTTPASPAGNLVLRVARLMGIRALVQLFALIAASLFISSISSPVLAQTTDSSEYDEAFEEEPERDSTIEEIVIIGSRKQSLQQVPISVTSFSAGELKELRIQNIADLADHTPNLEINTAFAASNPTLFIRGIGLKDYNANSASAVAVYMDGIAINSPAGQLFQMFDVESVEVLRGPQGSLYGRNATAGAIVVNSFRPDGEWASNGSITYGNYNDVEIEGAISFPLFDDYLQGRLAFTFQRRDGYTRNACSGWDPEAYGKEKVTAETMRDKYFSFETSDSDKFKSIQKTRNGVADENKLDMILDKRCIVDPPGQIVNAFGSKDNPDDLEFVYKDVKNKDAKTSQTLNALTELSVNGDIAPVDTRFFERDYEEGFFINDESQLIPTLDSLGKLKPYTNNADNWAARLILRSQFVWPTADLELLLNIHGGQNRSDSFHAQSYGASPLVCDKNRQLGCVIRSEGPLVSDKWILEQGYKAEALPGSWNEFDCSQPVTPGSIAPGCHANGEKPQVVVGLVQSTATNPDPDSGTKLQIPGGVKGADERVGWYNRDGVEKIDLVGIGLTALAGFDSFHWWAPAQLTWINGFEWNDRLVELDGDATPRNTLLSDIADTAWQFSSELRVENETELYQWTLGGFFLRERLQAFNLFPGLVGRRLEQSFDQTLTSVAPFVSGRFHFTDFLLSMGVPESLAKWNFKGGLRYNWEHKTFALTSEFFFSQGASGKSFSDSGETKTWTGVTGDATLSWTSLEESTTVYWKYSRGMKGGHFNAGLTVQAEFCEFEDGVAGLGCQTITAVEPEFIHSVETGLKGSYLDDRLRLSTAFFRYWYTDLQVFDIVNEPGQIPTNQLLNSDADVKGIELEFDSRPFSGVYPPMDGLFMRVGVAWLDTKFKDFRVRKRVNPGTSRGGGSNGQFDYSGKPLIAAPNWKFSGTVNWEIPISRYGSVTPQYGFSYRSQVSLDPTAHDLLSQPAYWLHNARLSYRTPDQHIEIAAWVRNFTDKVYLTDIFDLTRGFQMMLEIYAPPRMFGVTASYDW